MSLSAPKQWTFLVAMLLWLIGLIGAFVPQINELFMFAEMGAAFWIGMLGGLLLAIGCFFDGI